MTTAAQRLQARLDRRDLWGVEADIREVLAENKQLRDELAKRREHDGAEPMVAVGYEWAWRSASIDGPGEITFPADSQAQAREEVRERNLKVSPRHRYDVLRRAVGPWEVAP
jgi:hypothetical protein